MTVTSTVAPHWQYMADGTQTAFPYTTLLLEPTDLAVYVAGVRQTYAVHYTVSGVGVATGGLATFVNPPPAGVRLDLLRLTTADQLRVLPATGVFPSRTVEAALDDLVNMIQELRRDVARAPLLALLSATEALTLADPVAGYLLRYRADLTGLEPVNPALILPSAATLPLALQNGGTGATTAAGARTVFGVEGQVRATLTNRTGGALVAGDVVALDPANDTAVVLDDTVSSKNQFAVALAAIANGAAGEFLLEGIATVRVTGAVVRGRYLRKATTTQVAEDAGALIGPATDAPQGSFAVALTTGAAGVVTARLLGVTYQGTGAPVITGLGQVRGLVGGNSGGNSTTALDLTALAAQVRNPSGGDTIVLPTVAARTVDCTLAGPIEGGRDQALAFPANNWLHLYLIAQADGTYHGLVSLSEPSTGPTLPSGYVAWAYAGAVRWNTSSQLPIVRLRGAWAYYQAAQVAVTDGRATTETLVDCAAVVPPTATTWKAELAFYNRRATNQFPTFRVASGTNDYDVMGITGDVSSSVRMETTFPNVSQRFYYLFAADPTAGYGLHAYVRGYENPI